MKNIWHTTSTLTMLSRPFNKAKYAMTRCGKSSASGTTTPPRPEPAFGNIVGIFPSQLNDYGNIYLGGGPSLSKVSFLFLFTISFCYLYASKKQQNLKTK
jgi:hypothetical protein